MIATTPPNSLQHNHHHYSLIKMIKIIITMINILLFDNDNDKIIIALINIPVFVGRDPQSLLVLLRNSVAHDANLMLVMLVMMMSI